MLNSLMKKEMNGKIKQTIEEEEKTQNLIGSHVQLSEAIDLHLKS